MDFDWLDPQFDLKKVTPKEIEETFEDPFCIRLLPSDLPDDSDARYFCLGKTVGARGVFCVFWTDGKRYRVICAREMTQEESTFYDRKNAEFL
jgi:uncharacterized protein